MRHRSVMHVAAEAEGGTSSARAAPLVEVKRRWWSGEADSVVQIDGWDDGIGMNLCGHGEASIERVVRDRDSDRIECAWAKLRDGVQAV